jgi:hypothetical protein
MLTIPNELLASCRETLLKCQEFDGYKDLKAVFVTPELMPFRFGLREADNSAKLVDLFLEYILSKKLTDGQPVFPIFLYLLYTHYPSGDALKDELKQLLDTISNVMAIDRPQFVTNPLHKHKLFDLLLRLDFRSQIQVVRQVIDDQRIAAFLVHGPPDFGQRVLSYRLTHLLPRWESGRFIQLDAGANGTGKSSRSLWREIAKRLDLPPDTEIEALAEKVCLWWQTQDVILVIQTVDYIPPVILTTWLNEFWNPLVQTARCIPNQNQLKTHLLLFLVDYSGIVCERCHEFIDDPNQIQFSHQPLRLPPTNLFPENELDIWLDTASDVLPTRPNVKELIQQTQNGVPDLVYERICAHCGISWEGELAI